MVPGTITKSLLFAALCLVWGSTWFVIKDGLRELPVFASAAWRFALAGAVMLAIGGRLARLEGGLPPPWWLWSTVGTLHFGMSFGIVYWCTSRLPSGLVSLIWAVFPILTVVLSRVWLRSERISRRQAVGIAVAFAGVAALFSTDLRHIDRRAIGIGAILLLSPLVSAVSTLTAKRFGGGVSSALMNRNAMLLAAALLAAASVGASEDWPGLATLGGRAWFSLLYLSLVATVFTFSAYYWLMRHMPAYRLSLIAYITPVLALAIGWSFGETPVGAGTLVSAGVILGGVVLATASGPGAGGVQSSPAASARSSASASASSTSPSASA
jgi:drug/metabolite transporter (DMT)-like permease